MTAEPFDQIAAASLDDAMGAPLLSDHELAVLQLDNLARMDAYAAQGNVVNITGPYVAALADFLLPEGDPRRRQFGALWEVQLCELLDALDDELDRARPAPQPAPPNRRERRRRKRGK